MCKSVLDIEVKKKKATTVKMKCVSEYYKRECLRSKKAVSTPHFHYL